MSRGSTRQWRATREFVLERDGRICQRPVPPAGLICGKPATDAGHIVADVLGGTNHPDNLRAECEPHNASDGARLAQLITTTKGITS